MPDYINRTNLDEFVRSGNQPDYPDPPWLEVPRDSANATLLATVPRRYLTLTGDTLAEMTQAEKDVVDAQLLSDMRDAVSAQIDDVEDVLRAYALVNLDDRNAIVAALNGLIDAVINGNNLGQIQTAAGALTKPTPETVTPAQVKTSVRNKLGS